MSTYYVVGEEANVYGQDELKTFTPYDCTPEFHSTLKAAQEELEDWFPGGSEFVGIWKIEKVES